MVEEEGGGGHVEEEAGEEEDVDGVGEDIDGRDVDGRDVEEALDVGGSVVEGVEVAGGVLERGAEVEDGGAAVAVALVALLAVGVAEVSILLVGATATSARITESPKIKAVASGVTSSGTNTAMRSPTKIPASARRRISTSMCANDVARTKSACDSYSNGENDSSPGAVFGIRCAIFSL